MSDVQNDNTGTMVAFVSGALIGVAAALLLVKVQRNRRSCGKDRDHDYCYDGGDIFI